MTVQGKVGNTGVFLLTSVPEVKLQQEKIILCEDS